MDKKPYIFFFISLIIILSVPGLYAIHTQSKGGEELAVLTIQCDENKIEIPLNEEIIISYRWTHSVEGTPIIEEYNVTSKGLTLIRVKAQSFGAGHPYSAEELGGNYTVEDGYLVYTANYYIGHSLEILGNPEYNGTIIIEKLDSNQTLSCGTFVHALIRVAP